MRIRVVIVNYRCSGQTLDCARTVLPQLSGGDSLVIVNNSPDCEFSAVHECVDVKTPGANLGYGGAANYGLQDWGGDACLILNPDVRLNPNWMYRARSIFQQDKAIAILGGKCYLPGSKILEHAGGYLRSPSFVGSHRGKSIVDEGQYDQFGPVPYIAGSAIMIRNERWLRFDDGYFLYYEDTDLCHRAWRRGLGVYFDPHLMAEHPSGSTTNEGTIEWGSIFNFSRYRFVLKNLDAWDVANLIANESAFARENDGGRSLASMGCAARRVLRNVSDILALRSSEGLQPLPKSLLKDLVTMLEGVGMSAGGNSTYNSAH